MGIFDALDAAADGVQRAVFGDDAWEHRPQTRASDVNAGRVADPNRPVTRLEGPTAVIYTVHPTSLNLTENHDPHADHRPGVSAPGDLVEIPAIDGVTVATADLFVRLADGARFRVVSTYVDDRGRTKATVNRT